MENLIRIITIAALTFIAGTGFGTYYHSEILARAHVLPGVGKPVAHVSQIKASDKEDTPATISMQTLDEPLPLVFSQSLEDKDIQEDLTKGAAVLPLGTKFGQPGNVVITAHSTGTSDFGPYRFAFAKLSEIKEGQAFTIQDQGIEYTYKVYGSEVVWPDQVDKLPDDERSTVTLVTCWPLWTDYKRLLVHGELTGVHY